MKLLSKISKLWTPILVDEGATIPRWYGCSHWIPFPYHNPPRNPETFVWQKMAYPIPMNLILAIYYKIRWYLKWGGMARPEHYTSKIFQVYSTCPDCGKWLNDFPRVLDDKARQERAKLMLDLIKQYYTPEEAKQLLGE